MQDNALIACRCYKSGGTLYRDEKAEKKVNAIEIVLNYIENSIPKEKVEEKIEELKRQREKATEENQMGTGIVLTGGIRYLAELLEGK